MTDHTRATHLALLARVKSVLAHHEAVSSDITNILADLDAAIARITKTQIPWPTPVHLAMIGHRHGTRVVAAHHYKGLLDQIAVFCRSQWSEINDRRDPALLDGPALVREYFDRHAEDHLSTRVEWIDPDLGYAADHLEIGNYLALSSSHLSWPTTLKLDEWLTLDPSDRPLSVADTHYGWLISTTPSSLNEHSQIPADLLDALALAREEGCGYLLFDRDAATTDRLPCYDW